MEITIKLFEFIGLFVFAMSGAVVGMRERMDIFGIYCVACIAAFGGGVMRDVIANVGVPAFFSSYPPLITALTAATVTLIFRDRLRLGIVFVFLDALGLAVFVVSAGVKGIEIGYNFMLFLFVSTITGVGGGILRDVVCNKKPEIFQRNIYILAGMIGALFLWLIYPFINHVLSMALSMFLIVFIRMICYVFDVNLPMVRYRNKK